jgi:deoxyribonuclease V
MKIHHLHSWDPTTQEAIALQKQLAAQVDTRTPLVRCELVAGADISYSLRSPTLYAAVVVLRTDDWSIVETQQVVRDATFPYVPGLLTFREAPALLEAFALIQSPVDAVMIDGQGFAHPRRIGIASHMGLILDVPTIGCAKSLLIGKFREPGPKRGSLTQLKDKDDVIGSVVRTRHGVQPIYVSVGHKIDQASAVRLVLKSAQGYRIPEPTRQAHLLVNVLRRQAASAH